jgi:hypothetical protein
MTQPRDPRSEFEDEGIPDLQDGTPEQEWASDPQQAPLPGDRPMALDDYGTTADEQAESEPLSQRLEREEPDQTPETAAETGRLVAPDEGLGPAEERTNIAEDVGPDSGGFTAEEEAVRIEPE